MHLRGAGYDESRLGRIFSAADLCVIPSAAGLSAIHALVYGVPVLTGDHACGTHGSEVEAVVDGVTGRFYRHGDAADLADAMEAMLYPVPARESMAAACRTVVDTGYTPAAQEPAFLEAFERCLSRPGR